MFCFELCKTLFSTKWPLGMLEHLGQMNTFTGDPATRQSRCRTKNKQLSLELGRLCFQKVWVWYLVPSVCMALHGVDQGLLPQVWFVVEGLSLPSPWLCSAPLPWVAGWGWAGRAPFTC